MEVFGNSDNCQIRLKAARLAAKSPALIIPLTRTPGTA
jgi:hypothetical protein